MYAHLNLDILTIPDIYKLRFRDLEIAVAKAKGYAVAEFAEGNGVVWALLDAGENRICTADDQESCWGAVPGYLSEYLWPSLLEELRTEGHEPELYSCITGWSFRAYIEKSTLESPFGSYSDSAKRSVQTEWLIWRDLAFGACQVYLLLQKALREENPWGLIETSSDLSSDLPTEDATK